MKHETIKEKLSLYIDGGLNEEEEELVREHLKECEQCRQELKQYQENYNCLSNLEEVQLPDEFSEEISGKIKNEEKKNTGSENWFDKIMGLFRKNVRIPVGGVFAATVVVLAVILIIPLVQQPDNQLQRPGEFEQQNYMYDTSEARIESLEKGDDSRLASPQGADSDGSIERKVIYTADLQIEVNNIDEYSDRIVDLVQGVDGLISSSRQWKSASGRRYLHYQLRIPDAQFYQIVDELETYGEVTSRSLRGQDVTEEYIDVETRLTNMEAQEERYRQLLNQAERVEDILKIERELERVRSNIESMEQRLQYLSDRVSLSTINLQLSEPEPIVGSDSGLIKALRQAVKKMGDSFYQMIIYLGVWLPYLILIAVVYIVYRFKRRSDK